MNEVLTLIDRSEKALEKAEEYMNMGEHDMAIFWHSAAIGYINRAARLSGVPIR